jgi:hypothetical protein
LRRGRTQQTAQGQGDGPRGLAQALAEFFVMPLIGDRSRIRLIVENDRSKTTS